MRHGHVQVHLVTATSSISFWSYLLSTLQVELWEAGSRLGGHANTLQLREGLTINDTVLGGTYAGFANTLALLHELGWQEHHSDIPVTFAGAGVPGDPSECLGGWV